MGGGRGWDLVCVSTVTDKYKMASGRSKVWCRKVTKYWQLMLLMWLFIGYKDQRGYLEIRRVVQRTEKSPQI